MVPWMPRSERGDRTTIGWWLTLVLLGCSRASSGDGGVDAGSCAEQLEAATARWRGSEASCLSGEAGPVPDITFRIRNVGAADLWLPPGEYFGYTCDSSVTVTTCGGTIVAHSTFARSPNLECEGLFYEFCSDLVRLAPDASMDVGWRTYVELPVSCGCLGAANLPPGRYSARFAYSRDGGTFVMVPATSLTAEFPFVLSPNGGVIDIAIP